MIPDPEQRPIAYPRVQTDQFESVSRWSLHSGVAKTNPEQHFLLAESSASERLDDFRLRISPGE